MPVLPKPCRQSTKAALKHNPEAEEACRCDLFVTDPTEDKKALKRKKGDRPKSTPANQVLWLHGNPGTGKSTLAIYLTDALSIRFLSMDGDTLAYFFCDSAFDTRRTATSVIRGLLFQLIQQHPQLLSYVLRRYKERKAKLFEPFDTLWTIFILAATDRNTGQKYCIIDALDELDDESQKTLLRQLRETFHGPDDPPDVRFLVTSRPYREIRKHLGVFTHKDLASFPDVKRDIDQLIKERVAQLKYTKRVGEQVIQILRDKAEGTFLWVGIACNELEDEDTPSKDAISRLKAMPSGLNALYEKIFSAVLAKEKDEDTIRLVLSFVAVSQRPLNLLELSEACRLCQGENDIKTRTQFMREYIESCRLLVVIRDEKVLLLHQSVKDFLIKVGEQACFSELKAHADLAYRCLDYLIEQFHNPKKSHGHLSDYAVGEWPSHARMAQSRFVIAGAQAEFFHITSPCRESWLAAYDARDNRFPIRRSPEQFSILHVAERWGIPSIAEHVFLSYDQHDIDKALDFAVRRGYTTVLRVLLGLGSVLTRNSALRVAGNEYSGREVMTLLLEQRGIEITITEEVLKAAAGNTLDGKAVMALLLEQQRSEITITEDVLKAAARNWWDGEEVTALLLEQQRSEITITEEVLKAAAGNTFSGKEVMALLLEQQRSEITITEKVLRATAGNEGLGQIVAILLRSINYFISI